MKRLSLLLVFIMLLGLYTACNTADLPEIQATESSEDTTLSDQHETQGTNGSVSDDTAEQETTDQPEDDLQIDAPYTVLVVGPYDGSGVIEGAEYVIKEYDTYTDSTVDQKYVLPTDDGQSLEFVYQKTNSESFSGLLIHTYEAENGVEIKIDKNLNKIVFYSEKSTFVPDLDKPLLSKDECKQIAITYLSEKTIYHEQYECSSVEYYGGDPYGSGRYLVEFVRTLGNYSTYDTLILNISEQGPILVYNIQKFGCADGITLPSEQEHAQMQASAIKAMEKMYEGRKYTYELRDVYISYDAQGKLAVEFMIDMDVWPQDADEDAMPWAELCHLLIYPEDLVTEDAQKNAQ